MPWKGRKSETGRSGDGYRVEGEVEGWRGEEGECERGKGQGRRERKRGKGGGDDGFQVLKEKSGEPSRSII